jgi:hypothetical protein
MEIDAEKLQQAVLALLHLNTFEQKSGKRAWKALPWGVMDQLHDKGYISDPATKAKSMWLSDDGARLSQELFEKLFAIKQQLALSRGKNGRLRSGPLRALPVRRLIGS